ncbi:DNA repair protein RecO [Risungbinella massiliensis]|uniref:DNA repair protein RecO n=1 Tax=Risungbinella massiliensis TaxID=1329796 RepID=UPI0005CBFE13|nr:DNA repair protein RecO [Risungbinella massiliensis]
MLIRLEGFVMRARDYGESHKIVTVFSETHGKISFVARGAKKSRSRFGAVTEPFTKALFVCFASNPKSMPTLSSADLLESNYALRSDLLLTSVGAYWLELADKLLVEKEPDSTLFYLLSDSFQMLQENKDIDILTRILEMAFLQRAGYQPIFHECVTCGRREGLRKVSVLQGGMLCMEHSYLDSQAIPISEKTAKLLSLIQRITPDRLGKVELQAETKKEMEKVLQGFFDEYVTANFATRKIWHTMRDSLADLESISNTE